MKLMLDSPRLYPFGHRLQSPKGKRGVSTEEHMQPDIQQGLEKLPYTPPRLEAHGEYSQVTAGGFSLPFVDELYEDLTEDPGV
jgi:hypothetical protein